MKNLGRAIATTGIAAAIGIITVPSASAAVQSDAPAKPAAEKKAEKPAATPTKASPKAADSPGRSRSTCTTSTATRTSTASEGPGNLADAEVEADGPVDMRTQNEPISTGDLTNNTDGDNNQSTFEVEGSEQDQGERS